MSYYSETSTLPSAGVVAFEHPLACARCGGDRNQPGGKWGLCRDCRASMSTTEQEAWR